MNVAKPVLCDVVPAVIETLGEEHVRMARAIGFNERTIIWRFALRSSTTSCAFSTRVKTSPIPRMRPAIRSGWNCSRFSICSPIPANTIGLPTTQILAPTFFCKRQSDFHVRFVHGWYLTIYL